MTVSTVHFGTITADPGAVVEFPEGLPGFEDMRRFIPLRHPAATSLVFLQSLESPSLCFLAVPVQMVRPDYCVQMAVDDLELVGLPADCRPVLGRDVNALAFLSVEEGAPPSVNLRSPVVISLQSCRAVQAIRTDDRYGYREPLMMDEEEAVCS